MDLFINQFEEHDEIYNIIRDSEHPADVSGRNLCNRLWSIFEQFADNHFVDQFHRDFHARFWEMDLTVAFIEKKYKVSCPKPGPDICLSKDKNRLWIEAIAPKAGQGGDQVPGISEGIADFVPDDKIKLRYTSAIAEKHKKYKDYIENNVIKDNESYIIAINGSKVYPSRIDFDPPRIIRTVFPIGSEYITIDRKTGDTIEGGLKFKASVKKVNNTEIPLDIFQNPTLEGISAILFSNTDCCNRPEITGDDYVIMHNPIAKNPVEEGFIRFGREYIAELINENTYQLRFNDYRNRLTIALKSDKKNRV